jgi:hypothetical protein
MDDGTNDTLEQNINTDTSQSAAAGQVESLNANTGMANAGTPNAATLAARAKSAAMALNTGMNVGKALSTFNPNAVSNPDLPKDPNPFDAIFGHESNPTPSMQLPSFTAPSAAQTIATIQIAHAPPLAPVQTPMSNLQQSAPPAPLVSDQRAKQKIKPATQQEIDQMIENYYRGIQ